MDFRERGAGGEIYNRLPPACPLPVMSLKSVMWLTGNQTNSPLVHRLMPND